MSRNILIIEDDKSLNEGIKLALNKEYDGFYQCRTLSDARKVIKSNSIDLILLDVNLPDGNGIDFLKEVRGYSRVPIILITVNNMESDIVLGLEAGANDYVTKPFSLLVLRARVAVQLRDGKQSQETVFQSGDLYFDFNQMSFKKGGVAVELSKTEQKLLRVLCLNRGATLKRSYLIDSVWAGDTEYVDEHALTVTIKRLRDKLEPDPKNPVYIKTVYGIGYMWMV